MHGGTDASPYKKTGTLDALFKGAGKLQIRLVSLLELRTESYIWTHTSFFKCFARRNDG